MDEVKVFSYEDKQVRTVLIDGAPWWVLADVCRVLGLKNSRNASSRLGDDEKDVHLVDTLRGKQRMTIVNESGLYAVILRSEKPEAQAFKRWVTHEVLPTIRKPGAYVPALPQPEPEPVPLALPRLPTDAQTQRADRLIKMAEHPALTRDEQRHLLDLAVRDLTGGGFSPPPGVGPKSDVYAGPVRPTLSKRQERELMVLPEFICKVKDAGMKRCGSSTVRLYTLGEIAEMVGVPPAEFDKFADKRKLKTKFNGEWVRVSTPTGDGREFLYMVDVVRMFREEAK